MNRRTIIVASVLMAIAGSAIWNRNSADQRPVVQVEKVPGSTRAASEHNPSKRRLSLVRPTSRSEASITHLTVTATEPALVESCRKVEADAHRQLATLTATLGLNAAQRQRVFPVLVRGAEGFHPSMLVAGAPAGDPVESTNDAICAELNPAQEATFQEALMDDAAWWDDTIAQLEAGLDETTQRLTESPLTKTE